MKKLSDMYSEKNKMDESVKDEIINQGVALARLAGGNKALELEVIKFFGKEFRKTINEFKALFRGTPTPDQLIWIAGIHFNKDPMVIARELKDAM